jgi:hypothetical protein
MKGEGLQDSGKYQPVRVFAVGPLVAQSYRP